jgi:hypothetical protein
VKQVCAIISIVSTANLRLFDELDRASASSTLPYDTRMTETVTGLPASISSPSLLTIRNAI